MTLNRGLKIAFFVNHFPKVSEIFVATTAIALKERGNRVRIFGLKSGPPDDEIPEGAMSADLMQRGQNANPRGLTGWRRFAKIASGSLRLLASNGLRGTPWFHPRVYRRSLLDPLTHLRAASFAGEAQQDILHCQWADLALELLPFIQSGVIRGHLVVHFRGYDITQYVHLAGPRIYDALWTQADGYIANCETFRDIAIGLGCPPDKIAVIGSPVRMDRFAYRGPLIPDDVVRIVMVGRLAPRKAQADAFHALAGMKEKVRFDLDVIGDGPDHEKLVSLAAELGIAERVHFHGPQQHAFIIDRLKIAHLAICCSARDEKGGLDAPVNTIKEAMAVGVLVIGTRHGGIPELLEEGVTGWLAEESNPADLFRVIKCALSSVSDWDEIASNARNRVEERYDHRRVAERQERFYRKVIAGERLSDV